MATRKKPDIEHAQQEEWSDKEVERFASYSMQALSHSMGRDDRVAQLLCYLSLLRGSGRVDANPAVDVVAAKWQNYSSQAGNQAAHFMPGQLLVDNEKASLLTQDPQTRTRISCLFADVEDLPADFNKADTQAEAKGRSGGLCAALIETARVVIRDTSPGVNIDRTTVRDTYHMVWVKMARTAFENAMKSKVDKYKQPDLVFGQAGGVEYGTILNLPDRENASQYQHSIDHQQDILRHYQRSLEKEPIALLDNNMDLLERDFRP
jgi:hypothetical protein